MSFWVLLVPFVLLSVWVYAGIDSLYWDIFLSGSFTEKINRVEWYFLLTTIFFTGIPLWLNALYYSIRMWLLKRFKWNDATIHILTGYFSFFLMVLGHLAHPLFWGTMLAIHIVALILLISTIHDLSLENKNR